MRISLGGRLTLWFAIAIPAIIFGLTLATERIMVANIRSSLDDSLEESARAIAAAITPELATEAGSTRLTGRLRDEQFPTVPLLLRISTLGPAQSTVFSNIPPAVAPALERLNAIPLPDGRFDQIPVKGQKGFRVYTYPIVDAATGNTVAMVQTGESLTEIALAQSRLRQTAVIIGAVGSLFAVIVGMILLRRGFRPLRRILDRVHDLEQTNLRDGIPTEPRPPELQQLADSLNGLCRRLDAAFRTEHTFAASVSHDLRTPLTALQGQIEVLLMQPGLTRDARERLTRMSKEVRRLVRMSNNLLLNAQLEMRPELALEEVNLRELLEEVVAEVWTLAGEVELGLTAAGDVLVKGDHDLLKQMVLNVVDNALKFTPSGGSVSVNLSEEGGDAVVAVVDTGPGIPAEHLPHVMEPFHRAGNSAAPGRSGAGLGLAIVKRIADLHGGRVEIASREGAGTTVTLRLPLWTEAKRPAPVEAAPASA